LYLWIGIELNLLSFIPLIASSSSLQETEARVKYFIIQAIGRGLILTAGIISTNPLLNDKLAPIITIIFILRIAIKLGIAPFHQ
jgi:NADH:ubiquinone oxidoreductase subunit 2 (subunit N)